MVYHKNLISDPGNDGDAWVVPLSGFASPRYIAESPTDATGFDLHDCEAYVLAIDSGPTFSLTAEQTLDPNGLVGWFAVAGKRMDGSANALASVVTVNSISWLFPKVGVKARFRVTALTVANITGRIAKLPFAHDVVNPIQPISSPAALTMNGSAAQDAAISGSPVLMGLDARNAQKPSMSAAGDVVIPQATLDGKQVVNPYAIPELTWQYAAIAGGIVSSTADVAIKAAAGAGVRNYLTTVTVAHDTQSQFQRPDGCPHSAERRPGDQGCQRHCSHGRWSRDCPGQRRRVHFVPRQGAVRRRVPDFHRACGRRWYDLRRQRCRGNRHLDSGEYPDLHSGHPRPADFGCNGSRLRVTLTATTG